MRHLQLIVLLILIGTSCKPSVEKAPLPNVILFLVDDLGWKDLSSYGSDLHLTPNVDSLAESGVKFTDAYAACTVCSPTRASILTGKYPARINCTDWISGHKKPHALLRPPEWTQRLQEVDTTIAELLKSVGYRTAHIGKWHLGEEESDWPEYHGFDLNMGGWKMGMPKRQKGTGGYFVPYHNPRLKDGPEGEYLTERLSNEAVQFIRQEADRPFFLNFWFYNVHTPLQAREEKVLKYDSMVAPNGLHQNSTYAAMVEHMDEAVGKVVSALKATGVYDNTIIIFASDNGGLVGTGGDLSKPPRVTSNAPLKSGKGDYYEGGVRTPFIVSWKGKIKPASTDLLSISPDIFPTILGLIGQRDLRPAIIDGEDLSSFLLNGQKVAREELFWHYPHYHTQGAVPYSAIRKGNWKLIENFEKETIELYDLKSDVSESKDLSEQHPEIARELLNRLHLWRDDVEAQLPLTNPNYDSAKAGQWKRNW